MFEDRTYEKILGEVLADAPTGVDVRQGSIYYDAVAGVCYKIASYYADLRHVFDLVFITTAVGIYLDQKGAEYGIYRNPATSARYKYLFEGAQPSVGERFFHEGRYFRLGRDGNEYYLEAEDTGEDDNNILTGSPAVPQYTIRGLTSSAFGELIEPGVNIEDDEDYRQRIREKIAGPAENGNRQHYKTWCEEVAGVGRARIIPLWAGPNTVKGVIIGTEGRPATTALVERVQEYVDPGGTGLGDGAANLGARFTAEAASEREITVKFSATLASEASREKAAEEAAEAVTAYFKEIALKTPESEKMIARISYVGAQLYSLPSIIDYSGLTFNGEAANIELKDTEVAVLKEVEIVEIVR